VDNATPGKGAVSPKDDCANTLYANISVQVSHFQIFSFCIKNEQESPDEPRIKWKVQLHFIRHPHPCRNRLIRHQHASCQKTAEARFFTNILSSGAFYVTPLLSYGIINLNRSIIFLLDK
jgi:hypothetical protein